LDKLKEDLEVKTAAVNESSRRLLVAKNEISRHERLKHDHSNRLDAVTKEVREIRHVK